MHRYTSQLKSEIIALESYRGIDVKKFGKSEVVENISELKNNCSDSKLQKSMATRFYWSGGYQQRVT